MYSEYFYMEQTQQTTLGLFANKIFFLNYMSDVPQTLKDQI